MDALNGARIVFQGDEDSSVLVKEVDLTKPDPEHDDAVEECDIEPEEEVPSDHSETVRDVDMSAGSFYDEEAGDFAETFQRSPVKKMKKWLSPNCSSLKPLLCM